MTAGKSCGGGRSRTVRRSAWVLVPVTAAAGACLGSSAAWAISAGSSQFHHPDGAGNCVSEGAVVDSFSSVRYTSQIAHFTTSGCTGGPSTAGYGFGAYVNGEARYNGNIGTCYSDTGWHDHAGPADYWTWGFTADCGHGKDYRTDAHSRIQLSDGYHPYQQYSTDPSDVPPNGAWVGF